MVTKYHQQAHRSTNFCQTFLRLLFRDFYAQLQTFYSIYLFICCCIFTDIFKAFKDVCSHRVASVLHQIFLTIKILLVVVNSFAQDYGYRRNRRDVSLISSLSFDHSLNNTSNSQRINMWRRHRFKCTRLSANVSNNVILSFIQANEFGPKNFG